MTALGTLFVVATPIGNLDDITLRALRVLKEVAVVAAEDTRRTGNLLRHYDISTPLLSVYEHNEVARIPTILGHLRAGRSVALVSDAGTPGISDPGAAVVRAVREAGFPVMPIPGPSAVTAAMSVSGSPGGRFTFAGFPPVRGNDRIKWLEALAGAHAEPVIFFEAPHRIRRTLTDLTAKLVNRPILVGRELTKVHEEWIWGTAKELLEHFQEPLGEFVFLVAPVTSEENRLEPPPDAAILELFGQLTSNQLVGRREAVKAVAEQLGMSSKAVYNAIERAKKSVK